MNESVLLPGMVSVATALAAWQPIDAFYLAGGTALALQQGHRQSRALDFFTKSPTSMLPDFPNLDELLRRFTDVEWVHQSPDQLHWRLDGISVTLLAYPFPHGFGFILGEALRWQMPATLRCRRHIQLDDLPMSRIIGICMRFFTTGLHRWTRYCDGLRVRITGDFQNDCFCSN